VTAAQSGTPGRPASVRTLQHRTARDHITVRLYHLAEPWAGWVALAVLAVLLRALFPGPVLAGITAFLGAVLTALDHHLRAHRTKMVGRWIGPVTAVACAGWLAAVIYAGWSRPLLEAWLAGGLAGCIAWDIWIVAGDHHDLARAFAPAAEAAGAAGSRLTGIRRKKNSTAGMIQLPRGELITKDVAGRVENLEGALGYPPGSWAVTGNRADAGVADVLITDPRLLDRGPLPWPGPSAPGESVAVPFRLGRWADGDLFCYDILPLHHVREMGCTDAGKSMSWWSYFGEGITRRDYACLAADVTKGEQFLGPLRPALHYLATDPDDALALLEAVHRIVRARCDFLGRNRLTEWRPGIRVGQDQEMSYLDVRLEEAPDITSLLTGKRKQEHISDVRASRSSGIAWRKSYQRVDHTQEPTIIRGQMGYWCYGVMDRKDAEFGLSEVQRENGCRPEIWGAAVPGKLFADTLTIPAGRKTVPARMFWWGPDSTRIAAYCSEWPAAQRPLDDVTGEALEACTPRPASSAFPAPRSGNGNGNGNGNGAARSAVQPGARLMPEYTSRISPEEALKHIRAQLSAWKAEGTQFTVRMLADVLGEEVVCLRDCGNPSCTGRSRSWLYNQVTALTMAGVLAEAGGRPARWTVAGDPEGGAL
jgi:hypothetical protein